MNKSHLNGRIAAETTYFHVLDDIKTVYYITLQIKCIVCKITIVFFIRNKVETDRQNLT